MTRSTTRRADEFKRAGWLRRLPWHGCGSSLFRPLLRLRASRDGSGYALATATAARRWAVVGVGGIDCELWRITAQGKRFQLAASQVTGAGAGTGTETVLCADGCHDGG